MVMPCTPAPAPGRAVLLTHLEGAGQLLLGAGQCSQDGRGRGANVGAQCEGVGPLDADHTQAWRAGGEDADLPQHPPSALPFPATLHCCSVQALTDEWGDGRREHGTTLDNKGHASAYHHGKVACGPGEGGREVYKENPVPAGRVSGRALGEQAPSLGWRYLDASFLLVPYQSPA